MAFELPALPYAPNALEPYYSANTISFHHGKHHAAYVANLNEAIAGTPLEANTLEQIIVAVASDPAKAGVFNNAAQVWNHSFFWNCMKPSGGGKPTGDLLERIEGAFGSFEAFTDQFKAAAATRFGSGWGWLVLDGGALKVMSTANADTPVAHGIKALLTVDVWEHAYYLDYQNRRPDFLTTYLDKLVNWDFVAKQLAG